MQRKTWNITVYVIEQNDKVYFRRGWLLNIGIQIASAHFVGNPCIVTHDVDMLATNNVDYAMCGRPTQICSELSCHGNSVKYQTYTGGVVSATAQHWGLVNGFTNTAHGWGGEDDDLYYRFKMNNLLENNRVIQRPVKGNGTCNCLHDADHTKRVKSDKHYVKIVDKLSRMREWSAEWKYDGLSDLKYNLLETRKDEFGSMWVVVDNANVQQISKIDKSIIGIARANSEAPHTFIAGEVTDTGTTALGAKMSAPRNSMKMGADLVHKHDNPAIFSFWGGSALREAAVLNLVSFRVANSRAAIVIFVQPLFYEQSVQVSANFGIGDINVVACHELVPPFASTRFTCYLNALHANHIRYSKIALFDLLDVWSLSDIFPHIHSGVYVVTEPATRTMETCTHHRSWIQNCRAYGSTVWDRIKRRSMVCAGTIFGVEDSMLAFLTEYVKEIKTSQCNDQGVLNVMVWDARFAPHTKPTIWTHEQGKVLSLNVAIAPYNTSTAHVVHTGDNPDAVHAMHKHIDMFRKYSEFRDVLSPTEHTALMHIVHDIAQTLEKNGVDYMLDGGTLVGALMYNNRIPWDDDADIYITSDMQPSAIRVLRARGYNVLPSYNGLYHKAWISRGDRVQNGHAHEWPFVDISWLDGNVTHLWERRVKERKYAHHVYPRSIIHPTAMHVFGNTSLRVPFDGKTFLNIRFGARWRDNCVNVNYNHKLEKIRDKRRGDGNAKTSITCDKIPWV